MFGSLRYNIGTARNSNGPVPFACIKRKQGNFKPELPFQNNTGLPWTASQKYAKDTRACFRQINTWITVIHTWCPWFSYLKYCFRLGKTYIHNWSKIVQDFYYKNILMLLNSHDSTVLCYMKLSIWHHINQHQYVIPNHNTYITTVIKYISYPNPTMANNWKNDFLGVWY